MISSLRFGLAILLFIVAIHSIGALDCFWGGEVYGVRMLKEKSCDTDEDLCEFTNTTGVKIALGCAKSSETIKSVSEKRDIWERYNH